MVFSLGTTATQIIQCQTPTSFVVHADAANTAVIRLSSTDFGVTADYDELGAGQDLTFTNFIGVIWALAVTATQKLYIPFRQDVALGFVLRGNP